jgi:hypothetical protein
MQDSLLSWACFAENLWVGEGGLPAAVAARPGITQVGSKVCGAAVCSKLLCFCCCCCCCCCVRAGFEQVVLEPVPLDMSHKPRAGREWLGRWRRVGGDSSTDSSSHSSRGRQQRELTPGSNL